MKFAIANALEQFDVVAICSDWFSWIFSISNLTIFFVFVVFSVWILGTTVVSSNARMYVYTPRILFTKFLFVAKNLFNENISLKNDVFFYFLISVFTFILLSNLIGMVPYAVTVTSFLAVTLFFSTMGFIASLFLGLYIHGWEFFGLFIPGGTPNLLKIALVLIETVSYFARLLSLAIRLFANMMAGHALLKILSSFGWTFLINFSAGGIAALAALAIVWAVTVLELLIAFLQAYVYIVLTSIYLNEAVNLH